MSRGLLRTSFGALALSLSLLVLPLPAAAAEGEVDQGSVSVSVQIEPVECVTDCGGATPPGTGTPGEDLAETGVGPLEPAFWIALMLLVAGAAIAVRVRATRPDAARARMARRTPYAVDSGDLDPSARHTIDGGIAQAPHDRVG